MINEIINNEDEPSDPSEEEGKGNSVAGLSVKVGDNLRDFCDAPANKADEAEREGEIVFEITEAVFEVLLYPTHAWLSFPHTVRGCHYYLLSLYLSLANKQVEFVL